MKKQAEESKHDKFVRLAEARTNKIIAYLAAPWQLFKYFSL